MASLWLGACGLKLVAHQKISGNSSSMPTAAGHGPPGTMAAGHCVYFFLAYLLCSSFTRAISSSNALAILFSVLLSIFFLSIFILYCPLPAVKLEA